MSTRTPKASAADPEVTRLRHLIRQALERLVGPDPDPAMAAKFLWDGLAPRPEPERWSPPAKPGEFHVRGGP